MSVHAHPAAIHRPCLEPLEPRLAPAGVVSVSLDAQGNLVLTGDDQANNIQIFGLEDGSWSIRGLEDTLINYGTEEARFNFTSLLKNVRVDLGGGADTFQIQGVDIAGSVTIFNGKSRDAEIVNIDDTTIGKNLQIVGGSNQDSIRLEDTQVGGKFTFSSTAKKESGDTSNYTDFLYISGSYGSISILTPKAESSLSAQLVNATVQGSVIINTGALDDEISLTNSDVKGKVNINAGHGSDAITLSGGSYGPVSILSANSTHAETITIEDATINGAARIVTGKGKDRITLDDNIITRNLSIKSGDEADIIQVTTGSYKHISIDAGKGESNSITLGADLDTALLVEGNVSLTGQQAFRNSFYIQGHDVHITGNLSLTAGKALNYTEIKGTGIESGEFIIGGNLIYKGSPGQDTFVISSDSSDHPEISIRGKMQLNAGSGSGDLIQNSEDTFVIQSEGLSVNIGSVQVTAGKGGAAFVFEGQNLLLGSLQYKSSGGPSLVELRASESLSIAQNIRIQSTSVDHSVYILSPQLDIQGSVWVTNGNRAYPQPNEFHIIGAGHIGSIRHQASPYTNTIISNGGDIEPQQPTLNIGGDIQLSQSRGFLTSVHLRGLEVQGNVTYTTLNQYLGSDSWPETMDVINSSIHGSFTYRSASQDYISLIAILNTTFHSSLTLDTGGGADSIRLGHMRDHYIYPYAPADVIPSSSVNHFKGAVNILLGTGNDSLTSQPTSGTPSVENHFTGPVTIHGGAGTNTQNIYPSDHDTFAAPPSLTNFGE